jgi:hypothetical protein
MSIFSLSSRPISSPTSAHPAIPLMRTTAHAPFLQSSLSIQESQNPIVSCLKALWLLLCVPFAWLKKLCSRTTQSNAKFPQLVTTKKIDSNTFEQEICNPNKIFTHNTPEGCSTRTTQSNAKFPQLVTTKKIDPNAYQQKISNPNKIFAYNALVRGHSLGGPIDLLKYALTNKSNISSSPLQTSTNAPDISYAQGPISYEGASANATDWYHNFADSSLLGFCKGFLYAQDEHQVSEFPALYHVHEALDKPSLRYMDSNKNEIFLMKNVLHLGTIDTQTPLPNGHPLYGHQFANASYADIASKITLSSPQKKNIFFCAAPHISSPAGQPYQKKHLEKLFYPAFTAFFAAKQNSTNGHAVMHTGNWGAGAFGNGVKTSHLILIAAAYAAGVDARFYPLDKIAEFHAAQQLFNQIIQQNPNLSIDQFLTHLTQHAQAYGLVYGQSNGT